MRGFSHRVQLTLLLGAVFLPCALLIALSVRMVRQDRELRVSREGAAHKELLARAARKLRSALEEITRDEVRADLRPGEGYRNTETVFVGWTEGGQLVLPWEPEREQAGRKCRELLSEKPFETVIGSCDPPRAASDASAAAACYERAERTARNPLQAAYARWYRAEVWVEKGQFVRAEPLLRNLLATSAELADSDGIPFKIHAAQRLLQAGAAAGETGSILQSLLAARPWTPPLALIVLTEAAQTLVRRAGTVEERQAGETLSAAIARRVTLIDTAQALQNDFPRLESSLANAWLPYGNEPWLVGRPDGAEHAAVFVVRAADVFRRADIREAKALTDARDPAGEPLGNGFPGLKLVVESLPAVPDPGFGGERRMLYLVLSLAVAVTILAAYLFWRDLEREMRVTELRAQFVSSVSHELKTPLTAIRMFAETLQMGRCADADTQAEYLGTIVSECERLSRLVDGVLLFSKAEQGKKTYRFRFVAPAESVAAAARAMAYPLGQRGFRLHMKFANDLPQIPADRDAIEQAVLNLLSNAMKFSGDSRDIELALYREDEEVIIRVTDHGIGIAPEEQSRIFEKFYRAATRENQLIPGTGLGLALVAQIAAAHGGHVTVDSAPGRGSVFCLKLPVRRASAAGREETI